MSIAKRQYEALGARLFLPAGPFGVAGQTPLPDFDFGEVIDGDAGSEFIYVYFGATAGLTLNQGDVMVWDNSFNAAQSLLGSGYHVLGSNVGTVFFGGRFGDPASGNTGNQGQGNTWSYTFPTTGTYGLWVQRAGGSVVNYTTITAQADASFTTATAGSISALASGAANSETINSIWSAAASLTYTVNAVLNSNVLTLTSPTTPKGLVKGMAVAVSADFASGLY